MALPQRFKLSALTSLTSTDTEMKVAGAGVGAMQRPPLVIKVPHPADEGRGIGMDIRWLGPFEMGMDDSNEGVLEGDVLLRRSVVFVGRWT